MSECAPLSISIRCETKEKVTLMQNICIYLFSLLIYTTLHDLHKFMRHSILSSAPFQAFHTSFFFLFKHCMKCRAKWFWKLPPFVKNKSASNEYLVWATVSAICSTDSFKSWTVLTFTHERHFNHFLNLKFEKSHRIEKKWKWPS